MFTPEEFRLAGRRRFCKQKKIAEVYEEYEKQLQANNALDFDDLLLKTVQLFQTQPRCVGVLSGAIPLYYGG